MITVTTIEEVRAAVAQARAAGKTIGFVPTMGALHAGHASLIDAAAGGMLAKACDFIVLSIFVNPTQFGPSEDLAAYPRTPQKDLALCEQHGASLVFMPTPEVMYPGGGSLTEVRVKALSGTLCGKSRPTHFAGVCTVVAKLLNIVGPDHAFFGAKDFQQVTIIRRMTTELNFPVNIVACPTIREPDGLAMSSRNIYLSDDHRRQAPALRQALMLGRDLILKSHPPAAEVASVMKQYLASHAPLGIIDYLEFVDPDYLSTVETTDKALVIAIAVRFGSARLIDNIDVCTS